MDTKDVEEAFKAGVITSFDPTSQSYECSICGQQRMGDIRAHLSSRDHNNCLVWEAVRMPNPSEYLLHFLPPVVQDAKKNNEVEATNKAIFSYKCLVCVDKKPFTGLVPLTSHFTGKEHAKTKKNRAWMAHLPGMKRGQEDVPTVTSSEPLQVNMISSSNLTQSSYPSQQNPTSQFPQGSAHQSPNKVIQSHITGQMGSSYPYQQHAQSHPAGLTHHSYAGEENYQHRPFNQLTASPHQQPPSRQPTTNFSHHHHPASQPNITPQQRQDLSSNMSQLPPSMTSFPQQPPVPGHPSTPRHHDPATSTYNPSSIPATSTNNPAAPATSTHNSDIVVGGVEQQQQHEMVPDFMVTDQLSPACKEALRAGIVTWTGSGYFCNYCQRPMTGPLPLMQHVESDKHRKQEQMRTLCSPAPAPLDLPDMSKLKITADTMTIQPRPPRPIPQDHPEGPNYAFPWTITGRVVPKGPDALVYRNLSLPRGLVCIFNYHIQGTSNLREGAKRDSFNLKTLFSGMGYHVQLHEDLSSHGTVKKLDAIQSDPFLKEVDSFILVVLSHGDNDLNFSTNDGLTMNLDDMRYRFIDGVCPNLRKKPKIFLANFCRGTFKEKSLLHHDYIDQQEKEAPQDMITIHASINKFKALRDEQEGTVFVQALCEVLAERAHDTEFSELYLLLHTAMRAKGGTSPEQQSYAFKKFYFNPIVE